LSDYKPDLQFPSFKGQGMPGFSREKIFLHYFWIQSGLFYSGKNLAYFYPNKSLERGFKKVIAELSETLGQVLV